MSPVAAAVEQIEIRRKTPFGALSSSIVRKNTPPAAALLVGLPGPPLDHFILDSSAAAPPGMAAYAALGALAHRRHQRGLPALAIDWGLFFGIGIGLRADPDGRVGERGLASFTADDGRALHRLVRADLPQLGPLHLDPTRCSPPPPCPLVAAALPASTPAPLLRADLAAAPPAERGPLLERQVRDEVTRVLRLTAPASIPSDRSRTSATTCLEPSRPRPRSRTSTWFLASGRTGGGGYPIFVEPSARGRTPRW